MAEKCSICGDQAAVKVHRKEDLEQLHPVWPYLCPRHAQEKVSEIGKEYDLRYLG